MATEIEKLASLLKTKILANQSSPVQDIIVKAQEELALTLVQIVSDPMESSLLHWGKNDDPVMGTLEQLILEVYNLREEFKHRQLLVGLMNELKSHKTYICINYAQRTLFISRT